MSRYEGAYRWLLRLYPSRFRADYEHEMVRLFADQLADTRARGGSEIRVVMTAVADVIRTAPREHVDKEVSVAHPVSGPAEVAMVDPTARRNALLVASLPIWLTAILVLVAPGYMDPVFAEVPSIVGLPVGIVLLGAALVWMSLGILLAIRFGRSTVALLIVLIGFVAPSAIAVLLAPAVILILQN